VQLPVLTLQMTNIGLHRTHVDVCRSVFADSLHNGSGFQGVTCTRLARFQWSYTRSSDVLPACVPAIDRSGNVSMIPNTAPVAAQDTTKRVASRAKQCSTPNNPEQSLSGILGNLKYGIELTIRVRDQRLQSHVREKLIPILTLYHGPQRSPFLWDQRRLADKPF
jgi:hypothetical protein